MKKKNKRISKSTDDIPVGKRLGMIREKLGISVPDAARLMGRAPQQIYNIERSNIAPKLSTIQNYAEALGHAAYVVIEPVN